LARANRQRSLPDPPRRRRCRFELEGVGRDLVLQAGTQGCETLTIACGALRAVGEDPDLRPESAGAPVHLRLLDRTLAVLRAALPAAQPREQALKAPAASTLRAAGRGS
jgi:hypothetical protein